MTYSQFKNKACNRVALWIQNHGKLIPDGLFLQIVFRLKMGYRLNLKNPRTFSEKLQWLKLYDRNPEYTKLVDKLAVKDYVSKMIGKEYVIPTLGVWEKPEDIEWDMLPEQFVLKTAHGGGGGGVVVCKDKKNLNRSNVIEKLNKSLEQDIYLSFREWPYKNVERRIIAEKYISPAPDTNDLPDYKFFCFGGEPKFCQVISGRESNMCIDFFDIDWNHQSFHEPKYYPFADVEPQKPQNLKTMLNLASRLASGKPFSRIDFYDVNEKIYFGEITFFPTSGMGGFSPKEWDTTLGEMIKLQYESTSCH